MVVEGSHFDDIICNPTMEDLGEISDLGKRDVLFIKGNNTVELMLILDYMRDKL